ncbi:SAP domain-containing ribonucleoprotein-like [Portunus trituberculatus]|uniref:SAP domain-containing ribonucleoprotein-like n=1 Tax=Portunus trituberculatus TaxID=210409 RepID=UPI001E1CB0AB|nr:SAP domain-containing ribonucleoprotein-like [Portunus trituberculatus]
MDCGGDQVEMEGGEGVEEDFDEEEILGEEDIDSEITPQEEEAALGGASIRVKDTSALLEQPEKKKISLKRTQPPPAALEEPAPPEETPVAGEAGAEGEGEQGEAAAPSDPASPPAKKIIKLDGIEAKDPKARADHFGIPMTDEARKEARKARFGLAANGAAEASKGVSLSDEEKRIARAARFGLNTTNTTTTNTTTAAATATNKLSMEGQKVEIDRLMKRAERFGEVTSPALLKASEEEKKKARMKRFGEAEGEAKSAGEDDSVAKRKARFGLVTASDEEEKKRKRAERFAI